MPPQEELARRAPLNRREGDESGGFTWAFEKLAKVRTEVSTAYTKLRSECMAACGEGSGCDGIAALDSWCWRVHGAQKRWHSRVHSTVTPAREPCPRPAV